MKALKCSLCDYTTNDKSNFRRHRRLHMGSNPVNVLKCNKCSYTTILPRKFRDHNLQVHNERIETNRVHHFEASPYQTSTFHQNPLRIDTLDLSAHGQPSPSNAANMTATNALHTLLSGIHPTQLSYRAQNNPTLQTQCLNQFGSYIPQMQQQTEENTHHMASNYLRSIVSSIMNTNMTQRVPVTSTMTSSGYFLTRTSSESHRECQSPCLSSNYQTSLPNSRPVRVKTEPRDYEEATDLHVSSSGPPYRGSSELSQQINRQTYQQRYRGETIPQNEPTTCMESIRTNSTDSSSSQQEVRSSAENVVNTTVKSETTTIGVQCGLYKSDAIITNQPISIDCGIQCELLQQRATTTTGECSVKENTCDHCGITFEDEVLYSIHIGCHSHTDPFVCNVCGKQCSNKYGFYSHIMRGHHY